MLPGSGKRESGAGTEGFLRIHPLEVATYSYSYIAYITECQRRKMSQAARVRVSDEK